MSMSQEEFTKWILEKIEELQEEIHQMSDDNCPFCCQPEYPVKVLDRETCEIEELPPGDDCSEADYWTIDHYEDCFVKILDNLYVKIKKYGLWH